MELMRASNVFVSVATAIDGGYIMFLVELMCTQSAGLTETLLVIFSVAASFVLGETEMTESTKSHFMCRFFFFFPKIACTVTACQLILKLLILKFF